MKFEAQPYWLKQFAVSLLGARNRLRRYGPEFHECTRFLVESRSWGAEAQMQWQRLRLMELLKTARSGARAYYNLPECQELLHLRSLSEVLDSLPILEKRCLKDKPGDFVNKNVNRFAVSSTSGSTGVPTRVEHDLGSLQRRFAFFANHNSMAGVDMTAPSVRLSGRIVAPVGKRTSKPWLFNGSERQLFLSTYHLDSDHREVIGKRLAQLKPKLIDGYPSAILQLVKLLGEGHPGLSRLKAVIPTAETLAPEVRDELARISGAIVMDYYSASEGVPFIQQCPYGTYHVRWQSGTFEVCNDGTCALEGGGELITTSFVQDRTPLIRYKTGDIVTGLRQVSEEPCACGLSTPTVNQVLGRVEDLVYTQDGRALGMFTYRTLKYIDGIAESQVIQTAPANFTLNLVRVPGSNIERIKEEVKRSFERALGYEIELEAVEMDAIPKGPNGKVRLVQSLVSPQDRF